MKRGFTLAELLVATAIGGVAAAFIVGTLVRQQRFLSSAGEVIEVRGQLRDAADILTSDIRSASVAQFGIPLMLDTAIEMVTAIGYSIACTSPSAAVIGLPPATLTSGATLTSILLPPDTGDILAVYSADSARWSHHRIASFGSRTLSASCPESTGFTTAADNYAGASGYQATLTAAPATPVKTGSVVRFLRRARYSFYRSSDGDWYLGHRRCGVSPPHPCGSIQPVSGPYRPYRSNAPAGITFRYFDSGGAQTSNATSVARVDIVLRGETGSAIAMSGDSRRIWRDSVIVSASPRNRAR